MLAGMARARSPFFALQARGNVAGLRASPRLTVGQVFRRLHRYTYTITAPQRELRIRHRLITQAWQSHYQTSLDRASWDLRRRYLSHPGTLYSEFLSAYLSLNLHGQSFVWLTSPSVTRGFVPNALYLRVLTDHPPAFVVSWYSLTPGGRSYIVSLTQGPPNFWTVLVPDRWPASRTWASFAACYAGAIPSGASGFVTT